MGFEQGRFRVLFPSLRLEKEVYRLSLRFQWECPLAFGRRFELAMQRQKVAEDELRFLSFVRSRPLSPSLSASTVQRILRRVPKEMEEVREALLKEVREEHRLAMQKCLVLNDMFHALKDVSLQNVYLKERIRLRRPEKIIRKQGCVPCEPYRSNRQQLADKHVSKQKQLVKALAILTERSYQYEQCFLLNTRLGEKQLPMSLADFEALQEAHFKEAAHQLKTNWREWVVGEVQDALRDVYKFYQTDLKEYRDSELSRMLTLFDLMFNSLMKKLVHSNVEVYCDFIRRFAYPLDSDSWRKKEHALFIIELKINVKEESKLRRRNTNSSSE